MSGRVWLGFFLIMMMFGHNFVLNQTQSMQKELMRIHSITITEFNLLYSIPAALSILFIIPMGFFYEAYRYHLLALGAFCLTLGQALITAFGAYALSMGFTITMIGRIFEDMGSQVLYLIQGNMASSWMGSYAGVVFILPQIGEILNVFVTPWTFQKFGVTISFGVGLFTCVLSAAACLLIYFNLRKRKLKKPVTAEDIRHIEATEIASTEIRLGKADTISPPRSGLKEQEQTQLPPDEESQSQSVPNQAGSEQEVTQPLIQKEVRSVLEAGKVFWLVIALCGFNECLYFPFLDNANELITNRFCIAYSDTGLYLSVPFVVAMITSYLSHHLLKWISRKKLIFIISLIPLLGHSIIFLDHNCQDAPSRWAEAALLLGLCFFGMGLGTYYSVSFPAVGLCVPQSIRGVAYACMGFAQTIAMTLIPIISGQIIETEQKITTLKQGYKQSSLLFVIICLLCVFVSGGILYFADQASFMYDDQDQIDESEEEQSEEDETREEQEMKQQNMQVQMGQKL